MAWNRNCTDPACQIGGADKTKAKLGSESVFEALAEAEAISARTAKQGYPPVACVYLCPSGYWHHATKCYANLVVATKGAWCPIARATKGVTKAQVEARLLAEIKAKHSK